jgi:outer membrane biosynthesis protein TonB
VKKALIVHTVYNVHQPSSRVVGFACVCLAVCMHVGWWIWAQNNAFSLELWSASLAARVHIELSRTSAVTVEEPEIKPPPRVALPSKSTSAHTGVSSSALPSVSSTPAQASDVLTQQTSSDAPVDLTDMSFVVGSSHAGTGGASSGLGTSTTPSFTLPQQRSLQKSIALENDTWTCAWPNEALQNTLDEAFVVLKVYVTSRGTATQVQVVSHPGMGFDTTASACALNHRYTPALNIQGHPVDAWSPLIRVRFTRS